MSGGGDDIEMADLLAGALAGTGIPVCGSNPGG
jgi:hypothetical protein